MLTLGPAIFDRDVLTLNKTCLTQTLAERDHKLRRIQKRRVADKPDHWHCRLLRPRPQRPCRRTAEQRDEIAPPDHSITSSARASSVSGTVRPNAFAVLRLITRSYLVGDCTGSSPGFSPLRMRST